MPLVNNSGRDENMNIKLANPYLRDKEYLYHLNLSTDDHFTARFHDVKFVCMGGKGSRMKYFAQTLHHLLNKPDNCEFVDSSANKNDRQLKDISETAGRYCLFKVGPVLSASHGIGSASMSVLLHELLKLVHYAKCSNVVFIRIGTSGGLGIEPGTVVITDQAYNGLLEPCFKQVACGKEVVYPTNTDQVLRGKLEECARAIGIGTVVGSTMASNDFYEEQARLDGAFCTFTPEDKMSFLKRAHEKCGICNIEMESACFVATCNRAGVKSAVVCACIINRLQGDEVTDNAALLKKWEKYPQDVVAELIRSTLLKHK